MSQKWRLWRHPILQAHTWSKSDTRLAPGDEEWNFPWIKILRKIQNVQKNRSTWLLRSLLLNHWQWCHLTECTVHTLSICLLQNLCVYFLNHFQSICQSIGQKLPYFLFYAHVCIGIPVWGDIFKFQQSFASEK